MKRTLFSIIRKFWKMVYFRNPVKYARKIGVEVGNGTHFVNCPSFSSEQWLISIGERTNISSDVSFITHDGGRWVLDHLYPQDAPFYKIGPIRVGNNCFLRMRTMILPNVCIGDNCVIGGGSIVTKSIPEGQVWAGVPAHFVCTIEEYREKMLKQRKDINWKDYWEDKERELKRVFEII